MEVEGEITDVKVSCKSAVIRIHKNYHDRTGDINICGTNPGVIAPMMSLNESIRISFLTSPEKVNGLTGFNFTWTEVRLVQQDSECSSEFRYLCSYTRLCIDAKLKCNSDHNCGENDDTDEAHCNGIGLKMDGILLPKVWQSLNALSGSSPCVAFEHHTLILLVALLMLTLYAN
jgi:hypothetical protein